MFFIARVAQRYWKRLRIFVVTASREGFFFKLARNVIRERDFPYAVIRKIAEVVNGSMAHEVPWADVGTKIHIWIRNWFVAPHSENSSLEHGVIGNTAYYLNDDR